MNNKRPQWTSSIKKMIIFDFIFIHHSIYHTSSYACQNYKQNSCQNDQNLQIPTSKYIFKLKIIKFYQVVFVNAHYLTIQYTKSIRQAVQIFALRIQVQKTVQQQQRNMLEDKVNTLFRDSTEMYCQGNYEACLALLSDCLALEFDRSIIYSNKAIANYHLKQMENSFEDLEQALKINHLNYIAYFNLFSLHFINGNHAQSFRNLCLCISSAYTILCRCQPNLGWLENSLQYSFNNKQSMLLKAMLIYEKNQLRASLQLLKKIEILENNLISRQGVIKFIHAIQTQLGMTLTSFQPKSILGTRYILDTAIPLPEESIFQSQVSKMLKEFNEIYRKINDEMQLGYQMKENLVSSLISVKSEAEEDKQANRITAYNSTTFSRNVEQSSMDLSRNKELKLLSFINEKSKPHQTTDIQPLRRGGQKVKVLIEEAILNSSFDDEKEMTENIYAILSYKQGNKLYEHRTSIVEGGQKSLKWHQWTDELNLTPDCSALEIKVLNKRYTSFKDDLLGEAHLQISKCGPTKIPLFYKQECNGQMIVSVEVE